MQPNPSLFYKTFLELDGSNMASILAFDSGSMKALFSDKYSSYFSEQYPVIYRNKILKQSGDRYLFTNSIDVALKNNQVRAVTMILSYIVKYQNNFVSSYLFKKNMPVMIEKGIPVTEILSSKVFNVQFDYDAWPVNHHVDCKVFKAYNGSIFQLRDKYEKIYSEPQFRSIEKVMAESGDVDQFDSTKIKKIKYTINLLLQVGFYISNDNKNCKGCNDKISIMELL